MVKKVVFIACFLTYLMSTAVHATLLIADNTHSLNQLGDFEADFNWDGSALNFTLSNTTPSSRGGYITGIYFQLPGNVDFTQANYPDGFDIFFTFDGPVSKPPFGHYEYGFELQAEHSQFGIAPNASASFSVTALSGLPNGSELWSKEDIEFYLLDNFASQSVGDSHMLVQFGGFNEGGIDLVPAYFASDDGITFAVEIASPSTIALFFFGLICIGYFSPIWRKSIKK